MRLIFAVPGDLTSQTGGYRYAREVMVRLPGEGIDVIHCQLSEKFPNPTCDDLHKAAAALNAVYGSHPVSFQIFLRFRPGKAEPHRHQSP